MSSFSSFNPFGTEREALRSAVTGDLNNPIGSQYNIGGRRSTASSTMSRSGLPSGGSFSGGGHGLSSVSPGLRYKPPAYIAPGGARYRTGGSLLGRGGTTLGRGGGLVGQASTIFNNEADLMQLAADRQFVRNQEPINNMRELIGRSGEFTATGERTANDLTALGDRQSQDFEAGVSEAMGNFDQTYAADVTAAISGIRESYQPQMQAIRNGMNPDGTLMTPAQQKDAMFAMNQQIGGQVQNTYTQLASQYNQARAQLAQGFSGQRLNSQALVGSYMQQASAIRNAAQASALQFEASGNQAMADLIYRNPESIVSRFQGLLAVAGIASAPGGNRLPEIPEFAA